MTFSCEIVDAVENRNRKRKLRALRSISKKVSSPSHFVSPGENIDGIDVRDDFLKGHGTQVSEGYLRATVSGVVERVNKLVSVKTFMAKYTPEAGDVVIGRITEISGKRWKVDINSRLEAILQLSSVNLPSGQQRRRNEADELNMSALFDSSDVISAEVQSIFQDGTANLHARSHKYGKLSQGVLIEICPALVKRLPQHFHALEVSSETYVEVLLGCNGFIWVGAQGAATSNAKPYEDKLVEIEKSKRENIVRVANSIRLLAKLFFQVTPTSIMGVFNVSSGMEAKEILTSDSFIARVIDSEIDARS